MNYQEPYTIILVCLIIVIAFFVLHTTFNALYDTKHPKPNQDIEIGDIKFEEVSKEEVLKTTNQNLIKQISYSFENRKYYKQKIEELEKKLTDQENEIIELKKTIKEIELIMYFKNKV